MDQYIYLDRSRYTDAIDSKFCQISAYIGDTEAVQALDFTKGGTIVGGTFEDCAKTAHAMGLSHWDVMPEGQLPSPLSCIDDHSPLLYDVPDDDLTQGPSCTIPGLEKHIYWNEGELNVFVGPYGSGKSSLTRMLGYEWLTNHANGAGLHICAWEDRVGMLKCEFGSYLHKKHFRFMDDMSVQERKNAEAYRIRVYQPHGGMIRSLDNYFKHVRECAAIGYKTFIFDPWNEHDYMLEKGQTETNYVRQMLREAQEMVRELKINMWIVTHISASYLDGDKVRPFRTGAAFGSSNFANKATRGICMMRHTDDAGDVMVVKFDKVKPEHIRGERGVKAFRFDPLTLAIELDHEATLTAMKEWNG